jgi:PAS domain S-box-containing protein
MTMPTSLKPSIRHRTLATLMGTAGAGILAASLVFFVFLVRNSHQTAQQDLGSLSTVLAYNVTPMLIFEDAGPAAKLLEGLRQRSDISRACILRGDGTILAAYSRNGLALDDLAAHRIQDGLDERAGRLVAGSPVRSTDGHVLGSLVLESDLGSFHRQVRWAALALAFAIVIIGVGLLLLSLRLQHALTDPLLKLADLAASISGKKDFGLRAERQKTRELDILANSFNSMLDKIQEQDRDLGVHLDQLARELQERKQAEAALRESERKTRAIFDLSFGLIGLLSPEGVLLEVNKTALEFAGVSAEEVVGRFLWQGPWWAHSLAEQERLRSAIQRAARGEILRYETTHLALDGTTHFVDFSLKPILNEEGVVTLLIPEGRDITERKQAETAKGHLQDQLLQSQKMEVVGRLAGGVAHDFNNMLGVIMGRADLALTRVQPGDPIVDSLHEIQKAAERSADLTRQLLAFARKQTVSPRTLDLNDTVEGMLKMLRRLLGEDIDLVWKPLPGLWPICMDPTQIDQLLANLCVNARDAIQGVGRICIETGHATADAEYCAAHFGARPGDYVLLSVRDDGCGMTPEVLEHIFEPFYTTKALGKGTGLGLATVYGIVQQNEGFIRVRTEPGQGSTFQIHLPRAAAVAQPERLEQAKVLQRGRGETLLIVEDDESLCAFTREALESLGYRVLVAGTPEEALRFTKADLEEVPLLITDVVMPGMNGRDLAERICQQRPGLKCLFVSGYTADIIANQGVLLEGIAFLQKPYSIRELASRVREMLQSP